MKTKQVDFFNAPLKKERPAGRINQAADFIRLKRKGIRVTSPHLVVLSVLSKGSLLKPRAIRLAVQVSRKVGKATVRNVWRRRIKEIFRREFIPKLLTRKPSNAYDFLVIVIGKGVAPSQKVLAQELRRLIPNATD